MTSQLKQIINYEETSVYTAPKRDYTAREFIRECHEEHGYSYAVDPPRKPSSLAKYLKEGWERWCVGDHGWAGRDINEGLWHLSLSKIPRGRPIWILDIAGECDSSWLGKCL